MAAADHLNGQLKMFAHASEIKGMVTASADKDYSTDEQMADLWARKETAARAPAGTLTPEGQPAPGAGVYDSIQRHGYVGGPLTLAYEGFNNRVRLTEGHHRVAAAAALESPKVNNWIPLIHDDPIQQERQDAVFGPSTAAAKRKQDVNERWG